MKKKHRFKYISVIAVLSVVLTVLALIGALFVAAQTANGVARENSVTMVRGGLSGEANKLSSTVYDYSIWQVAYENAAARDFDWLYDNMASGAGEGLFDVLEVYWPEDGTTAQWDAENGNAILPGILPNDLVMMAYNELNAQADYDYAIFVEKAKIDGRIAMIAASRIEPEEYPEGINTQHFPINFMIKYWSDDAVVSLGESYLIDSLRIVDAFQSGQTSLPVIDYLGENIGYLAWTPPTPGAALARDLIPLLAVSVAIIIGFFWYVGRIAQKMADRLRANERNAAKLARTDFLTGLHNRRAFNQHLEKVVERTTGEVALITADVDGFKLVNDTHGHAAGDSLILGIAERLQSTVADEVFVARVGGDEFSFILHGPGAGERLAGAANALRNALEPAFYLEGSPFFLSMSMGLAIRQSGSKTSLDELVRQADTAMYTSKSTASHMLVRYDAEIDPDRVQELELETELRNAINDPEQFSLKYQPIVENNCNGVDLAEALVRWHSPIIGTVSPADFIPIAESTGLIRHITSMVLDMVCKDLSGQPQMTVSINVSPVEISDPKFHDDLANKVRTYGVRPDQILIELTEGVLVENPRGLASSLQKLRLLGHQIALDDFGTGYSSIGYLRQMEFSLLKVDKSLIDGVAKNKRSREVLSATLNLAKAIGIRVLAEGVETKAQARILSEMGFDFQQGFNFSPGLGFDELIDFANDREKAAA